MKILVIAANVRAARDHIDALPPGDEYHVATVGDRFPGRRFDDVLLVYGWDIGLDIRIIRQWMREQVLTRAMTADAGERIRGKVPWQD